MSHTLLGSTLQELTKEMPASLVNLHYSLIAERRLRPTVVPQKNNG